MLGVYWGLFLLNKQVYIFFCLSLTISLAAASEPSLLEPTKSFPSTHTNLDVLSTEILLHSSIHNEKTIHKKKQ